MTGKNAQLLGETLKDVMESFVSPRRQQSEQLMRIWSQLLPDELANHCHIIEFTEGVLKIKTDGPVYSHELRLCRETLLDEINRALAGIRITSIRISV